MTPIEFELWLRRLPDAEYDKVIQERISRLNAEQQVIAQAREVKKAERLVLFKKLADSPDEEAHERLLNALRDSDGLNCEHGRSYAKHCLACGAIDHLMFPELFDKDGFPVDDGDIDK
jgi:hypothetical protein